MVSSGDDQRILITRVFHSVLHSLLICQGIGHSAVDIPSVVCMVDTTALNHEKITIRVFVDIRCLLEVSNRLLCEAAQVRFVLARHTTFVLIHHVARLKQSEHRLSRSLRSDPFQRIVNGLVQPEAAGRRRALRAAGRPGVVPAAASEALNQVGAVDTGAIVKLIPLQQLGQEHLAPTAEGDVDGAGRRGRPFSEQGVHELRRDVLLDVGAAQVGLLVVIVLDRLALSRRDALRGGLPVAIRRVAVDTRRGGVRQSRGRDHADLLAVGLLHRLGERLGEVCVRHRGSEVRVGVVDRCANVRAEAALEALAHRDDAGLGLDARVQGGRGAGGVRRLRVRVVGLRERKVRHVLGGHDVLLAVAAVRSDHATVLAGQRRAHAARRAVVLPREEARRHVGRDAVPIGDEQDDVLRAVLALALQLLEAILDRILPLNEPAVSTLRRLGVPRAALRRAALGGEKQREAGERGGGGPSTAHRLLSSFCGAPNADGGVSASPAAPSEPAGEHSHTCDSQDHDDVSARDLSYCPLLDDSRTRS